jgi:hypothetical protein
MKTRNTRWINKNDIKNKQVAIIIEKLLENFHFPFSFIILRFLVLKCLAPAVGKREIMRGQVMTFCVWLARSFQVIVKLFFNIYFILLYHPSQCKCSRVVIFYSLYWKDINSDHFRQFTHWEAWNLSQIEWNDLFSLAAECELDSFYASNHEANWYLLYERDELLVFYI